MIVVIVLAWMLRLSDTVEHVFCWLGHGWSRYRTQLNMIFVGLGLDALVMHAVQHERYYGSSGMYNPHSKAILRHDVYWCLIESRVVMFGFTYGLFE